MYVRERYDMRENEFVTWARSMSGKGKRSGGKEFSSQAALSSYIRQHPKADMSKHLVLNAANKSAAQPEQKSGSKHGEAVVKSREQLAAELPKNPKSGRQSYLGVDVATIKNVKEFPQSKSLTAVITYKNIKGREVDKYIYNEARNHQ